MTYRVLDVFPLGENTSVTIEGNGEGLKNNTTVISDEGTNHKLLSVGMLSGTSGEEIKKTTTILIEGMFNSKSISI